MTDHRFRALTLGLLATTAISAPAFAQNVPPESSAQPGTAGQSPAPEPMQRRRRKRAQVAQEGQPDMSEIVITATKREENLQNVPIAVTVLGTKKLDQLNISNFEEYTKQLPSVSYQNFGAPDSPSSTCAASRRAATATTQDRCHRSAAISMSSR